MNKRHKGSCHCGRVHFEATLDLDEGVRKCNCSYCFKTGYRKTFAYGDNLVVTAGETELGHYAPQPSMWPKGNVDHMFCRHCGTQVFSRGILPEESDEWFHAVNISTLDDVSPAQFDAMPVIFEDGLHDRQQQRPEHVAYL